MKIVKTIKSISEDIQAVSGFGAHVCDAIAMGLYDKGYRKVVVCKNCKCFIPNDQLDRNEYPNVIAADGLCDNTMKYTDATDYCCHGERMVNDE